MAKVVLLVSVRCRPPPWQAARREGKTIMTTRCRSKLLVLAVALAAGAAGCAHADRTGGAVAAAPAPVASATGGVYEAVPATGRPEVASAGTAAPAPSATAPAPLTASPSPADSDPACRPPVLLEATSAALGTATVAQVDVLGCRNGFARLFAIAAHNTEIPGGNQVFLRLDKGRWRIAGRTSAGTDCGDPDLTAEIRAVCDGL